MKFNSEMEILDSTSTRTSVTSRSCFNRGTVMGPLKAEGSGKWGYIRARCKRYDCPWCGPRKLRKVQKRVAAIASQRKLTRFVSLTLDPKKLQSEDSIAYLRRTWAKMRVLLARRFGHSLEFIAVVQLQQSGLAHLHVLVGRYIPDRWLDQAWASVGGGFVDVRFVDVHRVAAYLSRYLARVEQLPRGTRRFSCSKGIHLSEEKKTASGWCWSPDSIDFLRNMRDLDSRIENVRTQAVSDGGPVLIYFEAVPL